MVSCFYSCPWTNPVSFLCWKHRNCVLLLYGKIGYHFNGWHSLNTELQYCWRSYVFFIVLFEFSCSLCMHIEHVNVIFFCHILLIIYFSNSWKKISDLMTFKSNLWSQFIKLACQSFMFPCTVHDFLMMSTNDALLWRFVFVYLELSLYLCFLVIKIHVYINLYKRVCYSNKFCNVFY